MVTISGEAGHDLGVDAIEEEENTAKESTHAIMILDITNYGFE